MMLIKNDGEKKIIKKRFNDNENITYENIKSFALPLSPYAGIIKRKLI